MRGGLIVAQRRSATVPEHDSLAAPISISSAAGDGTIIVEGDLDVSALPVLARHLARVRERRPRVLVLDLTEVSFLDCATAHAIMEAARALPGRPRPVLLRPSPAVFRLLSLTGLDKECVIRS
jgi:anti-anti-sigma factor